MILRILNSYCPYQVLVVCAVLAGEHLYQPPQAIADLPFENPTPAWHENITPVSDQESGLRPLEPASICSDNECQPRGTLFQWSYGTSFSGGPDLDEPLVTDRPDFTEASSTVGRGVVQLELGYTYIYDDDGTASSKSHSLPEPLLRYGILADWLEFRLGWNYSSDQLAQLNDISGSEDFYLGFKIGLTPQEGILPEMAVIPQMTVPTGSDQFTAGEVLPGLNWIYSWEINDFISTGGSTQFNRAIDEVTTNAFTEWAQSWTVSYTLTEKVGAYTEWFAFFPQSAETAKPEYYFNGGFTYLINNNVQWDIRAGVGLNEAADDYFVGTGISIRFL